MSIAWFPIVAAEVIAVRPGPPLIGTVTVDGSKNAALPLLAAAAALRRPVCLANVPASTDVQTMLTLLHHAGYHIARPVGETHSVVLLPSNSPRLASEFHDAARIRASYYLVPALLAMHGRARLPWPGGCQIGERWMEEHFKVYEAFGDQVTVDDHGYLVETDKSDHGTVCATLPFRSRGATIAGVLRAVVAERPLRLFHPNLSPEVTSVLDALRLAGWLTRANEDLVSVEPPVCVLNEALVWTVPGDKIEAGTLACAIAVTSGSARIEGIRGKDVEPVVAALRWVGIPATAEADALVVQAQETRPTHRPLRAIASLAPGGMDADFEPPLIALALGMPGTHLFADSINPGRHGNLLPHLARLGATIEAIAPTQCRLTGPQRLTGAGVEATDIRTGSALLIAGLTARGITTLGGIDQLRRGHADLPGKLLALGADICEVAP